jgi:cellulose synthase/poly-beta-1,6-N-acetylglucosamine synthase-like glycosyltransferase
MEGFSNGFSAARKRLLDMQDSDNPYDSVSLTDAVKALDEALARELSSRLAGQIPKGPMQWTYRYAATKLPGDWRICLYSKFSAILCAIARVITGICTYFVDWAMTVPRRPAAAGGGCHHRARAEQGGGRRNGWRVVALVPAHNEQESIGATIESLLSQTRVPDRIVVMCDNCTDDTYAVASRYPVIVRRTQNNRHRKSGALNWAWNAYAKDADAVVCADADTTLPAFAVDEWLNELDADPGLGGSSSKFTVRGSALLVRLQRAEFARWSYVCRKREHTSVLSGTGCVFRGEALREVAARDDREGPWSYQSPVEDFELTYQIRTLGWLCQVSPSVPAYTDAMTTVSTLWAQRMKWQTGTISDLIRFGLNKLTIRDWFWQAGGALSAAVRVAWVACMIISGCLGWYRFNPWWLLVPVYFSAIEVIHSFRIPEPERDYKDVLLAALVFPQEFIAWMRAALNAAAWLEILTGRTKDRWAIQYQAQER